MQKPKLIEVSIPLEEINRESAREKSIRHGHPSTLHLWWARRPLAAARAVLFAQLVDDPSAQPDRFPTEELRRKERDRLHEIIRRLVKWENVQDEKVLAEARAEILASTDGNPPPILDPFAGGGTIPLEAQRLGLEAHASDLNPVAVLINKALIEIPPMFRDQPPVFPGLADSQIRDWKGAQGLAADVRAYGEWMRDEAEQRIGHLYPKATLPDRSKATVIAWIWARTVTCPNPGCGIEMPLVRSWWLGKKKGKEAYVVPSVVADPKHPSGQRVRFEIGHDLNNAPTKENDGTMSRGNGTCVACATTAENTYIRTEATSSGLGVQLMAVVTEGYRRRIYMAPTPQDEFTADVERPNDAPDQLVTTPNHDVDRLPMYGMPTWSDAFTNRQLVTLTTFSDLIADTRQRVLDDGGLPEYSDAIATYLSMAVSRILNKSSSICSWDSSSKMEAVRGIFARQAIPMAWDFAEANVLGTSSGNFAEDVGWITRSLERLPDRGPAGRTGQADAPSEGYGGGLLSTDPPYYDNIGYSELSDFFYVWLRRSLTTVYPELFSTMLVPKSDELVANPYRHDGKVGAKEFFEKGFRSVFAKARETALQDFPITVYYAFKQSESGDDGEVSTGWETLLDGMIRSGWEITSTWPIRSELSNRMVGSDTNALASSIVLSLRPRPDTAESTDRRGFISALQAELPDALRKLQQGQIAPVDLPQAAIGPGMAVFSRYARVIEPDGSLMTVRSALARINEILDQVLNEQEGDFDPGTRFALAWYRQHGYAAGKFGDADSVARARNTSVDTLDRHGILASRASQVQLIRPTELPTDYDVLADERVSTWEVLHHLIRVHEAEGIGPAGQFLATAQSRDEDAIDSDLLRELGHLLFRIAEAKRRPKDALAFNSLVTSWPDIVEAVRLARVEPGHTQVAIDFSTET